MRPVLLIVHLTHCRSFGIRINIEINRRKEERRIRAAFVLLLISKGASSYLGDIHGVTELPRTELMLSTERRAPLTCGTDNSWGDFKARRAETAAGDPSFSHAYATRGGQYAPQD